MTSDGDNPDRLLYFGQHDTVMDVACRQPRQAYPKSWTGPWTLDSGLWTLDSGLWTLDSGLWFFSLKTLFRPPKKTSISPPPPKKPLYPTHETPPPPINISPLNKVSSFQTNNVIPPHPPPRKNLYVSPLKLPPPKKKPSPPPNKKYNYIGID